MLANSFVFLTQDPTDPVPVPVQTSPTGPVEVRLPPELVDVLTPPDPGWFTQPVATILAASIALVAAGVAYRGVLRQIHTTREENLKNRHADLKIAQRTEAIDVLTEAAAATDALCGVATRVQVVVENPELSDDADKDKADAKAEFHELYRSTRFLIRKLEVIGLQDPSENLEAVLDEALTVVDQLHLYEEGDWEWTIYEVQDKAVESFKNALDTDIDAPSSALLRQRGFSLTVRPTKSIAADKTEAGTSE